MDYATFLASKAISDPMTGIASPGDLPASMFPFQRDITQWALRRGRAAIFAGTGLGKGFMELVWDMMVALETKRPVLHFAPLGVSAQLVREAVKFGIPARLVSSELDCDPGFANIVNYQKIHRFDFSGLGGADLDESSILKNHTGQYRTELIAACQRVPFRLAATATPAPNDFMEIGNHAEFLGVMSYTDMLATFFIHDGGETQKWRLKGHAENEFWRWLASWAVMLRKHSDLGYSDDGYDLPPLRYHTHTVSPEFVYDPSVGSLFQSVANTMAERLSARRNSVDDRVAKAVEITPTDGPFVWWCNLNSESEAIAKAIPGAVETKGADDDDVKERKLLDFAEGRTRVLVTKPKVAGFGMNWQHCHRTGFIGLNDSWEQFYQSVRRFWRFGQTMPVDVDIVAADTEGATVANIRRKEADADRMAASMLMHMSDINAQNVRGMARTRADYNPTELVQLPSWIGEYA